MLDRLTVTCHLVAFEPEAVLPKLASDIRSLYANRAFIRQAPCSDYVIGQVATLILSATESGVRFRKYECLRTIRQILRGTSGSSNLSEDSVELLFRLYCHYVFSEKEEIQWCVSTFLKDRLLAPQQVDWLIDNALTSVHLVNRLLRYPSANVAIAKWAEHALRQKLFPERSAELLGLLIESEMPAFAAGLTTDTLLWAIYYSRTCGENKSRLLCSVMTAESAESALTIAMRLQLPEVVRKLASIVPG